MPLYDTESVGFLGLCTVSTVTSVIGISWVSHRAEDLVLCRLGVDSICLTKIFELGSQHILDLQKIETMPGWLVWHQGNVVEQSQIEQVHFLTKILESQDIVLDHEARLGIRSVWIAIKSLSYGMQWCPQILIDFVFKVIHSLTESKMSANPAVWGLKWMVLEVVDRNALLTSFYSITTTTWLFFLKTQERSFVLASLERLGQMWKIFTATCFLPNLITVVRLLLDYDHGMEKAWHLLVARTSECLSLKVFWYPKKWTFF